MLIGLTGLKGVGKDTVAAILVKDYNYERRAFADPLKKSVAGLFDIPFHVVDKLKNEHTAVVTISGPYGAVVGGKQMTFRTFLQRYGTEAHRDVPEMGHDFWVDLLLPVRGYYAERNIVVSDVRFDNEAKRIRFLDGIVVDVSRKGVVCDDPHRSEAGLQYIETDYTIFNNGSLEDLRVSVEVMMEHFSEYVA
jgi:hypothetical protein